MFTKLVQDKTIYPSTASSKGIALLELVIVLVVIILLCSGVIDYSLALKEHALMVEAARIGAHAAARVRNPSNGAALSTTAVNKAKTVLLGVRLNPVDYRFKVQSIPLGVKQGIRLNIQREATKRFFILPGTSFRSNVSSVFCLESGIAPEPLVENPTSS